MYFKTMFVSLLNYDEGEKSLFTLLILNIPNSISDFNEPLSKKHFT